MFADGAVNLKQLRVEFGIPRSTADALMSSGCLVYGRYFYRRGDRAE
jgi:hypothetical protein